MLPRPSDPRLWLMEVRPGMERQLVVSLLHRALNEPLLIKSAFTQDHLTVRCAGVGLPADVAAPLFGQQTLLFRSSGLKKLCLTKHSVL